MKNLNVFPKIALLAGAMAIGLGASAQTWLGSGSSSGSTFRSGNVGIGLTGAGIAPLDVRGNNIYLAPTGTTGFSDKFVGLGESGGDCNLYGFRAQTSSDNFINVGIKQDPGPAEPAPPTSVAFSPTISWGNEGAPIPCPPSIDCVPSTLRPLNFEFDDNPDGCGDVVVSMHAPAEAFQFRIFGQGLVNGSFITSDARYKTGVTTLGSALETVGKLRGVSYGFDQAKFPQLNLPDGRTNGFIAQEVMEVMPEIVGTDQAGYHSINYDAVVPVLVEAVKEQNAIVESQRAILESQDAVIQDMARELEEIKALLANMDALGKTGQGGSDILNASQPALFQNVPNPFGNATVIPYYLPETVKEASIEVFSISGQQVAGIQLNERGNAEAVLDGTLLESGVYTYTLVVDGLRTASKRMVVTK